MLSLKVLSMHRKHLPLLFLKQFENRRRVVFYLLVNPCGCPNLRGYPLFKITQPNKKNYSQKITPLPLNLKLFRDKVGGLLSSTSHVDTNRIFSPCKASLITFFAAVSKILYYKNTLKDKDFMIVYKA